MAERQKDSESERGTGREMETARTIEEGRRGRRNPQAHK